MVDDIRLLECNNSLRIDNVKNRISALEIQLSRIKTWFKDIKQTFQISKKENLSYNLTARWNTVLEVSIVSGVLVAAYKCCSVCVWGLNILIKGFDVLIHH